MKISLKLANGATLEFDGDSEEFDRISEFLANPPDSLTREQVSRGEMTVDALVASQRATHTLEEDTRESDVLEDVSSLDPRFVAARIDAVGARTDMELVTVMAQLAVEAGDDGLDYKTVDRLFTELGLRKPTRFAKTFANAKAAGLVRNAGYGRWRPTVRGENFARGLGKEEVRSRSSRRTRSQASRSDAQPDDSDS